MNDPDVVRWLKNIERGSRNTAEVSYRRLGKASELLDMAPKEMVSNARQDLSGFEDRLEDLVASLEGQGKAPGYITGILKNVKSWLRRNNVTLTRRIKISNSSATPTIEDEQVPTQDEMSKILRNSTSRVRAAEALIAFAGLRPESIGNDDGSDGLMVSDLPDLKITDGEVKFEKVPAMVVVRAPVSKTRRRYFSFLIGEGCNYLKEYLEERLRSGEKLEPQSPLIAHERGEGSHGKFLVTRAVSELIRDSMRRAGVFKRPYVLRSYFDTNLIIAESKREISHPYLQFHAGHTGDIEATYSTNKGRLPPKMVEGMRKAFSDCEPYLSTLVQPLQEMPLIKEAQIQAIRSIAKNMFGMDLLEVKVAKEKEENRELTQDETIELFENEMKKVREKEDPQTSVTEAELDSYLKDGWQFVSVLPSQRILIKK